MRAQPGTQFFRHGEGDEVIGDGQQLELLTLDPLSRIGMAALGTGTMIAGVIDKVVLAAVGAAINLPSQSRRAAVQDSPHGPAMGGKKLRAKLPFILRPMSA